MKEHSKGQLDHNSQIEMSAHHQPSSSSDKRTSQMVHHISQYQRFRTFVSHALDSVYVIVFMSFLTLFALFGDDIRLIFSTKDTDTVWFILFFITFGMFLLELLLTSLSKDDYFLSFFFALDLISTLSILLDIGWVSEALYGSGGTSSVQSTASLARAGRASKIATRAGRIIRIMRLIRLVKLYKHAQQALIEKEKKMAEKIEKEERQHKAAETARRNSQLMQEHQSKDEIPSKVIHQSKELDNLVPNNENHVDRVSEANNKPIISEPAEEKEHEFPQESNVGRKLSDLTTKRVITLVLSIIISIPLLNQETYVEDTTSHEAGLRLIHLWAPSTIAEYNAKSWADYDMFNLTTVTYINEYKDTSPKLIFLKIAIQSNNIDLYNVKDPNNLRTSEKLIFAYGVELA